MAWLIKRYAVLDYVAMAEKVIIFIKSTSSVGSIRTSETEKSGKHL